MGGREITGQKAQKALRNPCWMSSFRKANTRRCCGGGKQLPGYSVLASKNGTAWVVADLSSAAIAANASSRQPLTPLDTRNPSKYTGTVRGPPAWPMLHPVRAATSRRTDYFSLSSNFFFPFLHLPSSFICIDAAATGGVVLGVQGNARQAKHPGLIQKTISMYCSTAALNLQLQTLR